jgi:flagellar motor switch protein FliM
LPAGAGSRRACRTQPPKVPLVSLQTTDFDFRRPSKLGRDISRGLELMHEVFARRVGTTWGSELRAYVQIAPAGIVQLAYDDIIRSMPNPNVLVVGEPWPIPGAFVVEFDLQLGMILVDRLLGGEQDSSVRGLRRPSDIELELLGHLGQQAVMALSDVLEPVGCTDPRMRSIEINPQLVQVAAPSDPALLFVFNVTVSGPIEARGTISLVYPTSLMSALLEHVASLRSEHTDRVVEPDEAMALLGGLGDAEIDVAVRLAESSVAAADLLNLSIGDVLRLDHRVGRPAVAVAGEHAVLDVALGKVGPRRAAQIVGWHVDEVETPSSSTLTPAISAADRLPQLTTENAEVAL